MKLSMTGRDKGDLLIQVIAWEGLTVSIPSWSISVLNYPLMVILVIIMRQQQPPTHSPVVQMHADNVYCIKTTAKY